MNGPTEAELARLTEAAVSPLRGQTPAARDLDVSIAHLLTAGTYLAIAFLSAGFAAMLLSGISPYDPAPVLDPARLVADLLALRPSAFLWLGLVAVIGTPTARIVAALIGYLRTREWEMAAISAGILGVLTLSVILARLAEA